MYDKTGDDSTSTDSADIDSLLIGCGFAFFTSSDKDKLDLRWGLFLGGLPLNRNPRLLLNEPRRDLGDEIALINGLGVAFGLGG